MRDLFESSAHSLKKLTIFFLDNLDSEIFLPRHNCFKTRPLMLDLVTHLLSLIHIRFTSIRLL